MVVDNLPNPTGRPVKGQFLWPSMCVLQKNGLLCRSCAEERMKCFEKVFFPWESFPGSRFEQEIVSRNLLQCWDINFAKPHKKLLSALQSGAHKGVACRDFHPIRPLIYPKYFCLISWEMENHLTIVTVQNQWNKTQYG